MVTFKTAMFASVITISLLAHSPGYADDYDSLMAEGLVKMIEASNAREREAQQEFVNNLKAAQRGDKEAQYNVGLAYSLPLQAVEPDYAIAFEWFLKSAQQGHAPAQEQVAEHYSEGLSVEEDLEQAFHWYQKAAAQGSADAIMALGHMYKDGEGVAQNIEKAKELFLQMADSGDSYYLLRASLSLLQLHDAHYPDDSEAILYWMEKAYAAGHGYLRSRLIQAYTEGKLVPPNDAKVFQYLSDYSRAQATRDEDFLLAVMYEEGRGVKKNQKKADELFEHLVRAGHPDAVIRQTIKERQKKAQRGNAQAQYDIAKAYLGKGKLAEPEIDEVMAWLEKAALQNHREARIELAHFYANPTSGARRDQQKALRMLEGMAEEGDVEMQIDLFRIYRGHDHATALHWLKAAVNQGDARGQYYLAEAYFNGELGLARDISEAVELYYAAANQGVIEAIYEMGHMYDHGHGVEKDLEIALQWYEVAAEAGYSPAKQKVTQLKGSR